MSTRSIAAKVLVRTGIVVLVTAVLGAVAIAWLWRVTSRNLTDESSIVPTRGGPIEIASVGSGPAVLLVHGSPGGYDQILPLARSLSKLGYRGITVSRPGYLRTPLTVGATPAEQADALAALLQSLDVAEASVIGLSGGGPVALQLARRHPESVHALVLIAAVSQRYDENQPELKERSEFGLIWDLGALLARTRPSLGLRMLGVSTESEREQLAGDPETIAAVRYLFQSLGFMRRRLGGYVNDVHFLQTMYFDRQISEIRTPVLVVHARRDRSVPFSHAANVVARVPGAELRVVEEDGHAFFVLRHRWLVEEIDDYLNSIPGRPATLP